MKKIILILMLICSFSAFAQIASIGEQSSFMRATGNIIRPANLATYSSGSIIRDTMAARAFIALQAAPFNGGSGYIIGYRISFDTAIVAPVSFRILTFRDSTGWGATLATDTVAFQLRNGMDTLLISNDSIYCTSFGTTAAGAGATAGNLTVNVPFTCLSTTNNIYAVIISKSAFKPRRLGRFSLMVNTVSGAY